MTATQNVPLDAQTAVDHLLRFLNVEGVSGEEAAIAAAVSDELQKFGVPKSAIRFDTANERISLPTQTGNLFVDLPGTKPGPRLMFSTHLDTVPLCAGAKPTRNGNRIASDGTTALGGDNRTGCAVLVSLAETLLKHNLPHPPIRLLFTVREESGLQGARTIDPADLKDVSMCFNFDGKVPADLILGAVGQESFTVEIRGKAAHAGVAPEKGISATLVAALALEEVHRGGWFGKVVKGESRGTSNLGVFGGKPGKPAGDATNVVTDYAFLKGEARSSDAAFASQITAAYRAAFEKAAAAVKDVKGEAATAKFAAHVSYPPFKLAESDAVIAHAKRAATAIGLSPTCHFSNGGLDANWLVQHGVPAVTLGAGQYEIHTVHEYVELPEFIQGCQLAVALATLGA